ncbi:MAG: hypothetical protein IJ197_02605 [Bacteroidaceae bacterium]|nr:hypothetical protein [Bacteroidaceae bacterium]
MKKKIVFILSLLLTMVACDSGDIEERSYTVQERGKVVKLTATVSGVGSWDNGYAVALAGFSEDENYATMQRTLASSTPDGTQVELVLSNLTEQIETVEFAITNNLRKRIVTLSSIVMADYSNATDTIRMDLGEVDVDLLGALQFGVFDKACIQCHGGNGRSAAGLNLTKGQAYANLVDVPSSRIDGMYRVVSGRAEESLLHKLLNAGGENILTYNHTEVVSSQFKNNQDGVLSFIDEWINGLKVEE